MDVQPVTMPILEMQSEVSIHVTFSIKQSSGDGEIGGCDCSVNLNTRALFAEKTEGQVKGLIGESRLLVAGFY